MLNELEELKQEVIILRDMFKSSKTNAKFIVEKLLEYKTLDNFDMVVQLIDKKLDILYSKLEQNEDNR